MKKKIIITVSVLALVITGAIFAVASHRPFGGQHRFGGRGFAGNPEKFIEKALQRATVVLDLTEAQQQQIKAIVTAEKPVVQPLVEQLATTRKELQQATNNGQFNEQQVQAIASKQGQTLTQLIVEKERVKSQIYAVLTPEQRAKAEKIQAQFMERIHDHFAN
ncbi:MAG: Spy/CpxP family protein refolding chaperone [Acidobacteria bacterium]|nr:Spy/CpxP family protein refolding chaperone [Acidobacteriota bacterium]